MLRSPGEGAVVVWAPEMTAKNKTTVRVLMIFLHTESKDYGQKRLGMTTPWDQRHTVETHGRRVSSGRE
jgi:hypothetical protein